MAAAKQHDASTPAGERQAFRAFMEQRTMLFAYIHAIVRDFHLAEDTLQDTAMEIAANWSRYDPDRPFANWARGVARRVALANLRRARRQPATLGKEVLEAVAGRVAQAGDQAYWDQQREYLKHCLERLPASQRRLVEQRYGRERSYAQLAVMTGRSKGTLYTAFSRIHQALLDCVERRRSLA